MRFLGQWLLVCILLSLGATTCRAGDVSDYLTQDGKLRHKLEFRDEQGGVVGFTGQAWIIEPSGEWSVVRILLGNAKGPPLGKGKLTEKQMAALANHLATQDFLKLRRRLGDEPPSNPRLLTISFGDRTTALVLKPSSDLSEAVPLESTQAAEWSRLVALAFVIQYWTKDDKAGPKK